MTGCIMEWTGGGAKGKVMELLLRTVLLFGRVASVLPSAGCALCVCGCVVFGSGLGEKGRLASGVVVLFRDTCREASVRACLQLASAC